MRRERYSVGWADMRGMFAMSGGTPFYRYGDESIARGVMGIKKVDSHEYKTEAKTLPIDVCKNMWLIKYGNEAVSMELVNEQDPLMWEIGNRLWWSNELEYDKERDSFACRS